MTKESRKPELRFDGFEDAWEQRKLGAIMNVTSVKRIHQSDWTNSGVRFLRARDIVSAAKNEEPEDYLYISKDKYDECSMISGKVALGDILVTGVGTIGVPYLIKDLAPLYFKDGNIIWFQNENKVDGHFLLYSFWSETVQRFIEESAGTGTVGTYTIESGKRTPIYLPRKKEEQHRVGDFFRCLDHLITLHQRNKTSTHLRHASTLEQNRNAWEQRKLGDVVSSFEYGLNVAAREYDGKNKYLRITDIDDVSRIFKEDTLTSPDTELTEANNYLLQNGDILFARTGASVGKSYIYRESDGLVYFAGFLIRARIKEEFNHEFIFQNTLRAQYEKYVQITSQRSGQPGVNAQEYAEFAFLVPCYAEQKKIADFLHRLDTLITLHQRKP